METAEMGICYRSKHYILMIKPEVKIEGNLRLQK
jgi:hypothetical protein